MFIGRKSELSQLEDLYQTNRFQFAVIYGAPSYGIQESIIWQKNRTI